MTRSLDIKNPVNIQTLRVNPQVQNVVSEVRRTRTHSNDSMPLRNRSMHLPLPNSASRVDENQFNLLTIFKI